MSQEVTVAQSYEDGWASKKEELQQSYINVGAKEVALVGPERSEQWIAACVKAGFQTAEKASARIIGVQVKLILENMKPE